MTVKTAIITNVISAKQDDTVDSVMALFDKHGIRAVPVVDAGGNYVGMFSIHQLLKKLLPLSATIEHALPTLDFIKNAAPEIAERKREMMARRVGEVLDESVATISPETSHSEGILLLVRHGSPLPVLEEGTQRFVGLLTEQSMVSSLRNIA